MSYKRKAIDDGAEPAAKKEAVSDPIPRHIPSLSFTLFFKTQTWEHIAPGRLYYAPLCQTPKYMFDAAMKNQFYKFYNLWHTMEIHAPKIKISNLIMLQDDLRVQNSTPTDATAFTQVVYMLKYCPVGQKQYFKLCDVTDSNLETTKTLTYELSPRMRDIKTPTQLIEIDGFKDFDTLGILGAKANSTAGFIANTVPQRDPSDQTVFDVYVAPNTPDNDFKFVSGNLRPPDIPANFIPPASVLTYCRNQNGISFHKYGDQFETSVETNLNGIHLIRHKTNDFLGEYTIEKTDPENSILWETEWAYPSRNRPFNCRVNYYDTNTNPITEGKTSFKPLTHMFLCMPPIRKPNGALLGQRCAVTMEQEFSLTFHANAGTFFASIDDNAMQVAQDNAVILRRNFYPTPERIALNPSPFCTNGIKIGDPQKFPDTFEGLANFIDTLTPEEAESLVTFPERLPLPVDQRWWVHSSNDTCLTYTHWTGNIEFRKRYLYCFKQNLPLQFKLVIAYANGVSIPKNNQGNYIYWTRGNICVDSSRNLIVRKPEEGVPPRRAFEIDLNKLVELYFEKYPEESCSIPSDKVSKKCNLFFT